MKRMFTRALPALALCLALLIPSAAAAAGMANFAKNTAYAGFPDVAGTEWYAGDVQAVVELGIMNGRGDGSFGPALDLTLGEAVTMAAKTRDVYLGGGTFTPGGSPWYGNAVDYAVAQGIVTADEYADYGAKATRADMINLFAWALPAEEYARMNRIASIPDVDGNTPYADEIYLLYGAGILTGNAAGECMPLANVTRCEAAAIINRVALPASRRAVALTAPAAGTGVGAYDGSFSVSLPAGWAAGTLTEEQLAQNYQLFAFNADGSAVVMVQGFPKAALPVENGLYTMAVSISDAVIGSIGTVTEDTGLFYSYVRGFPGFVQGFTASAQGETSVFLMCYLENSASYYVITLCADGGSTAGLEECRSILYAFDAAL